jgi:hypothetical protein
LAWDAVIVGRGFALATLFSLLWGGAHQPLTRPRPQDGTAADSSARALSLYDVRTFIGLGLALSGIFLALTGLMPDLFGLPLPAALARWRLPLGGVLGVIGTVLLLRPARRRPSFGDGPLIATLTQAGFRIAPSRDGWRGQGSWKGVAMTVLKSSGHEAGRFGRPWTIVVALPGRPAEPWPFQPEEGLIIDRRPDGFSVAMADLSRPERMHRLGERLDHLLGQRC